MTGVLIRIRDSHRGTFLVVQWLRPPLPAWGVRVQSLAGNWDPTCFVAKRPKRKEEVVL